MKTHYDILEVSKYASDEVIKRAYKVLAKKYHPDLQEESKKQEAEEMMKKINESYAILTDPIKKEKYDKSLEFFEEKQNFNKTNSNNSTKTNNSNEATKYNVVTTNPSYEEMLYRQELEKQVIKSQQEIINRQIEIENQMINAYYDRLRAMGYTIKEPFSFKEFMRKVMSYFILYLIVFLMFRIPFVNDYFKQLELENPLFKILFNILRLLTGSRGI